jgi:hypothetical protein
LVEVVFGADREVHGFEAAEAGGHGLDEAAHGGHHHLRRVLSHQPVQDLQPPADRVGPRGQPLVGQRLPGREVGHRVRAQQVGQGGGQVVGLVSGGRDGQQRRPAGDRGGHQRARGRRAFELEVGRTDRVEHGGQGGIGQDGLEQTGQLAGHEHGGYPSNADTPLPGTSPAEEFSL